MTFGIFFVIAKASITSSCDYKVKYSDTIYFVLGKQQKRAERLGLKINGKVTLTVDSDNKYHTRTREDD